jgi:hypothetical protein
MRLAPLRNAQMAAEPSGIVHRHLKSFLDSVARAVTLALPPSEVRFFKLSAAEVTANFDATGKGNMGGPYDGWAICNGQNGTDDMSDLFPRCSTTGAGGTGGSSTTSVPSASSDEYVTGVGDFPAGPLHTHTFTPPYRYVVPLMRLEVTL